jgi:hypothetical protein
MPFIDLNKEPFLFKGNEFDITIIGAGAAGILLAVHLTNAGKKVLLMESGHFSIDDEKQKLNEVESAGKFLTTSVWGRKRAIGGTTLAWGGQSLPFTSTDFNFRPWIENSGWPITYETIAPYYNDANTFMGIDTLNYHEDIFKRAKIKDPGLDPALIDFHVSKWAKEPNFQVLYKDFLQQKVTVVYNAQLQKISQSANGSINEIEVFNFSKEKITLKINTLIIAAGGIETVRILLNNNIGNHSNWLGKCFMEHPCIELGDVITSKPYKIQKYFNTHIWKKNKYSTRLSLSKKFQEENGVLNCSASFMFRPPKDKFDPYAELAAFKKDFKFKRLIAVTGSFPNIMRSALAYIKDSFYYKVNAANKLVLMIEQEPVSNSYIALSNEKDVFGLPKAKISWHITYKTWETVLKISDVLKSEIERLNIGKVKLYDNISSSNKDWINYLFDVNHHMGGCRMSSSPEKGVVNKDLQVWDVPNLYVCSCAVFPTSSHSNPTLTMLALGVRLSEHIAR